MSDTVNNPQDVVEDEHAEIMPTEFRFDFIKSNLFRVIHADGAYGGITPQGNIHMGIFNERSPIPQSVVHEVAPDGTLGIEKRDRRQIRESDVIREIEIDIIMNVQVAKALHLWLGERINLAEKMLSKVKETANKEEEC